MTRDLSVEQPACIFRVRDCPVMQSAYASLKYKNTPFELVWVVMQLTPSVVTTLASPLTLLQHINRGREVHEGGLGISALLCWRNRDSLCPHLCLGGLPLVLQSLEAEFFGEEKHQNQIEVSWGAKLEEKVYLYLFSRFIKIWCPSSSQIIVQCVIESLFMIIW